MDERQFNTFMNRLAEMLQGVRQYIGARYVPHFLDDPWNDTTQYEALDIVDNGMGTSYIAKKPVPAATPLSDREFWFVYGSTSGAIINLQNQIDAIVNTTIPGINSEIEALMKRPVGRKMIVIGDSFGYGMRGDGGAWTTGWIDYLVNIMGTDIKWYDRAAQPLGSVDLCFISSDPTHNTWATVYDYILEHEMGDTDPASITDVVILGGNNEQDNSDSALVTYLTGTFFPHVKATCPNARIALGCVGLDANLLVRKCYKGYKEACYKFGAEFINDLLNLGCDPQYDSGYGHWNDAGYAKYNPYIAEAVLYGHTTYNFRIVDTPLTLQSDATFDGGVTFRLVVYVSNHGVLLRVNSSTGYSGWRIINATNKSSGSIPVKAFLVGIPLYFTIENGAPLCPCFMIDKVTGGIIGCGSMQLLLDNGDWYVNFNGFLQQSPTDNLASNICYVFDGATYSSYFGVEC